MGKKGFFLIKIILTVLIRVLLSEKKAQTCIQYLLYMQLVLTVHMTGVNLIF